MYCSYICRYKQSPNGMILSGCYFSTWLLSVLAVSGQRLGFSVRLARIFFFSLNRPEWETLTWRPLVPDLSTIFSSLASKLLSAASLPRSLFALLVLKSGGISYRTFASDFFFLRKVSFHHAGSAMTTSLVWKMVKAVDL